MSVEIEVIIAERDPHTYAFEVPPRVGEHLAFMNEGAWEYWEVTHVVHYAARNDLQMSIHVKPASGPANAR